MTQTHFSNGAANAIEILTKVRKTQSICNNAAIWNLLIKAVSHVEVIMAKELRVH